MSEESADIDHAFKKEGRDRREIRGWDDEIQD